MSGSGTHEGTGRARPVEGAAIRTPDGIYGILGAIADPVCVKDIAGRYVYVNDGWATLLGKEPADVLGRTDAELLPPARAQRARHAEQAAMAERAPQTVEESATVNGERRVFRANMYAWSGADDALLGVVGLARDVTSERAVEANLRVSETRFRLLADTAPALIWTAAEDGRCDFFNAGWLRFTGVPLETQLGTGWLDLVHPDDRAQVEALRRESMAQHRPFRAEYRLRRHDGTYHWILDAAAPRHSEDGEFQGYVGSATDIHDTVLQQHAVEQSAAELEKLTADLEATVETLRKRTSEAEAARERAELTERQARFLDDASRVLQSSLDPRATLQSVADLAVPRIADRCTVHLMDGGITRIDSTPGPSTPPAVEQLAARYPMWGRIGPARVARTGAAELYPEVDHELLKEAATDDEHLRLLRDAGIRSAMVVPMKAGGRILGTMTLLSVESGRRFGVSDLPLAEELARRAAMAVDNAQLYRKAEDASRAKSEFLATMSHELRTPLNAISGYTDLLQLGVSDAHSRRQHLDRIKASTWQLLSMIEEILTFSRLEAGTARLHRETVRAQDLAREAADLLDSAIRHKGLDVRLDLPEAPLELQTDRLKVRQILMNLLSNAVKFTEQGAITLDVREDAPHAVFRVTDTGMGIRAEQLDRIFEPFWQADSGRTRRSGGTGIGLAVAWRLAELLGGRLDVESTFGAGSTFTLRLPLR